MIFVLTSNAYNANAALSELFVAYNMKYVVCETAQGLPLIGEGDVLLVMGGSGIKLLSDAGLVPKNRTPTSLRGHEIQLPSGGKALATYDPYVASKDYSKAIDIKIDASLAVRLKTTGSTNPVLGSYSWVPDFAGVVDRVEQMFSETGKPVNVSTDLETLGLDEFHPDAFIVSIFFTVDAGHSLGVRFTKDWQPCLDQSPRQSLIYSQIEYLLTSPKISLRGANLKYDNRWMRQHWGLIPTNFKLDTTLVGSLLDENRSNSLTNHSKLYTTLGGYDDEMNTKYDKGRMDLVPDEDLLVYAGGDTDATYRVADRLKLDLLKKPKLANFYVKLLHPSARAFEYMEHTGVLIDVDYYTNLRKELVEHQSKVEAEALSMVPQTLKYKHEGGGWRLSRSVILKDFLFSSKGLNLTPQILSEKTAQPSTAQKHLLMFEDHPEAGPFIQAYKEYTKTSKTLSTYVDGFMKHLRSDNRLHPSYMLFKGSYGSDEAGTVTGRLSARDPAVQCCVGETEVVTDVGVKTIEWLVDNEGAGLKVLTHTGKWRSIIGVYRNGVKPVFDVKLKSGHVIRCTGNHPLLTVGGWVRTDELQEGDTCYVTRAPYSELHKPNVLQLDSDEEQMLIEDQQRLEPVRWSRDSGVRSLDEVRKLPERYGREAGERLVNREDRCERELLPGKLSMGDHERAGSEQNQQETDYVQRQDVIAECLGEGSRDKSRSVVLPTNSVKATDGEGSDEFENPELRLFQESEVISITPAGEFETFDLTIDRSHSFIGNGIAVHNTIPKHTKWAKKLRRGYIAPPGYVYVEWDFSQGELRVAADVANEQVMIAAYNQGIDLHMITGGRLNGYSPEQMMQMKQSDDSEHKALFKRLRQGGKAGNFGLIYGMSAGGYQTYAKDSYQVIISSQEAEYQRDSFFQTYPGLLPWHAQYKKLAHKQGYIESPLGRVRHLPLINAKDSAVRSQAERQAINSPIQSTLSDLTMFTQVIFYEQYGPRKECQFIMTTHDSLAAYVAEDQVTIWVPRVRDIMQNLPLRETFGWYPRLVFEADAEVGPNLAELVEYNF